MTQTRSRHDRVQDILDRLTSRDLGVPIHWSEEQEQVFWGALDNRVNVLAGGEGSAKSTLGAALAFCWAVIDYQDPLIWIVGADFEDARREMDLFLHFVDEMGILQRNKAKMKGSEATGSTISGSEDQQVVIRTTLGWTAKTVSGYDPLKLGREEPDIIIGCEVSRWEQEVWNRCIGRLARKASRMPPARGFFSGSFETSLGWFPETWTLGQGANELDLRSFSLPSWANPIAFPGGANDPAILQLQASMTPERFLARHVGRPSPPRDAVFPEFKVRLHVRDIAIDPTFPVHVFIDPATYVYAVEFVQFVFGEVRVMDEVYLADATHEQVVLSAMGKPAWRQVKDGVMDVAAQQHHGGLGSAHQAWVRDTGLSFTMQYCKLDQTIERIRSVLQLDPVTQRPRLVISPRCQGLIAELGGGPSPIKYGGMWRNVHGQPDSKCNDACKALGYGLIKHFGTTRPQANPDYMTREDDFVASYMGPVQREPRLAELLRRG